MGLRYLPKFGDIWAILPFSAVDSPKSYRLLDSKQIVHLQRFEKRFDPRLELPQGQGHIQRHSRAQGHAQPRGQPNDPCAYNHFPGFAGHQRPARYRSAQDKIDRARFHTLGQRIRRARDHKGRTQSQKDGMKPAEGQVVKDAEAGLQIEKTHMAG